MTNIIKTIESFREFWFETFKQTGILNEPKNGEVTRYNIFNYRCKEGEIIPFAEELEAFIIKALKAQEQEHQKVTDFLIKSHAFDMKELKEKHQKKLKEINEFGGDETDAYNLIDKLNEEK